MVRKIIKILISFVLVISWKAGGMTQRVSSEWTRLFGRLRQFGLKSDEHAIVVDISDQRLYLIKDGRIVKTFPISTSKYGIGNKEGSYRTPLGMHRIFEKIGEGAKIGTVFTSLNNTGRVAEIYTDRTDVQEDFITTRIMWLEGLEFGVNNGEGIDSRERRIYIHGTPEEGLIGTPASHGCIRMKNRDIVELFDLVERDALVYIRE